MLVLTGRIFAILVAVLFWFYAIYEVFVVVVFDKHEYWFRRIFMAIWGLTIMALGVLWVAYAFSITG